jgi:penicillin G amidase
MDGIVSLPDLERPVRVRFDQSAVPYIRADSRVDLYLAQGFVTASERMFQMDVIRRVAEGELSAVFGSGCLAEDKLMRTLGFARLAKKEYSLLSSEARSYLKAYCLGVNSYINQNSKRLPIEFFILGYHPRLWQPEDTLAILKFLQYEVDESWRLDEFRNRVVDKGGAKLASRMFEQNLQQREVRTSSFSLPDPTPIPGLPSKQSNLSFGSNAWAVSGTISNSGGSLLACDKHSPFTAPNLWYVCSLQSPDLHTAGATIPGVPGIIMGRNQNIAWVMTALKADVQDLFIEQFSEKYPLKYRIPGGWSDATEISEEITQRFATSFLEKVIETRHGPILLKSDTSGVALSWAGFHAKSSALETVFQLNQAANWDEFRRTLKGYEGSPHCFIFADRLSNIGLQVAGSIPIRKCDRKVNNYTFTGGAVLLPGWSDTCAWLDNLKFEDLPTKLNNGEGFIVANDPRSPFISTTNSNVAAQRIVSLLSNYKKIAQHPDLPEMSAMQGDEAAYLNALVKSEIAGALKQVQTADKFDLQAIAALDKWDGQLHSDSGPACIYESFLVTFLRRVLDPRIGRQSVDEYVQRWPRWSIFVAQVLKDKPQELLPPGERSYTTFILTTFDESLKNLRMSLNSENPQSWAWKRLHQADFLECTKNLGFASTLAPLVTPGPIGVGGDQDCVNASNIEISQTPWLFQSTCGPIERMVIDMSDQDKFYQNLTLGQSGHLISNYRFEQLRSWLNIEPHAVAFSDKQVELQMQHTLVLSNTY